MSIKMHRYPNGRDGLAAFCDVCDQQITKRGYVVWNGKNPETWLLIHQAQCDPGRPTYDCSMELAAEIVYLANSAGIDLDNARDHVAVLESIG